MPGAAYSPQMIEKSDSTRLALATIAILGQAPSTPETHLESLKNLSIHGLWPLNGTRLHAVRGDLQSAQFAPAAFRWPATASVAVA